MTTEPSIKLFPAADREVPPGSPGCEPQPIAPEQSQPCPRGSRLPRAAWQGDTAAALRLVATQLRAMFDSLDARELIEKASQEPGGYAQLASVLVKLTEAAIKYERHRASQESDRAAKARDGGPKSGLTEETLALIERELKLL